MKSFIGLVSQGITSIKFMLLAIVIFGVPGIYAQDEQSVTGKVIDEKTSQAVPYASVALMKASGSGQMLGTISDANGVFNINPVPVGKYNLMVSFTGYKKSAKSIDVVSKDGMDAGIIILKDTAFLINETVVVGERVKARTESDRTVFFITKKMLDASITGMDVLKLIPGIQIDFMQNISLEGSSHIQFFVDGLERDKSFISQLNPGQIDKIEVITRPSSNFDGSSTGALNIILKKEKNSGINGQIYAEIPTSGSEIYIRPAYSLNYGFKKLNLYTSYKGELTYLEIHENTLRESWNGSDTNKIISNQYVSQKNWSHRFNYGFDYLLSSHDQINFYAFYNPYSRELDGNADAQMSGNINNYWNAKKEDTDINTASYYSLYYKHNFGMEGREITMDINNYKLKAKNQTEYRSENSLLKQTNTAEPGINETGIRIDFATPIGNKVNFSMGVKTKFQLMQDRYLSDFHYNDNIVAAYGNITCKNTKYDLSMGLRAESSVSVLKKKFRNPVLSFFPNSTFNYKINTRQNIQLSYNRSVRRPNIYQLNPTIFIDGPFTVSKGNPFLKPEYRSSISLEHSIQFKSNYFASGLFYNKLSNVINNLTLIDDTSAFETLMYNMGNIYQFGVKLSGSLKIGAANINPYLRLFGQYTSANSFAKAKAVENKHNPAFESGLSAIISFKHDLSFSFVFQYASPKNDIQGNSFCDALYFLSLEKSFKQKINIGIVSAIPFTRSFIYQGSEIKGYNFYSYYEGKVKLSNPFWFKLSYQINPGKNRDKINHDHEEIVNLPKKGF